MSGKLPPTDRARRPGGRCPTYDHCVVLLLAVFDEVNHARYTDVGAAREARLTFARGDLPARTPSSPWRLPADSGHAR